jgi:hypothetical protein
VLKTIEHKSRAQALSVFLLTFFLFALLGFALATVRSASWNRPSSGSAPSSRAALRNAAACFGSVGTFVFVFIIGCFAQIACIFLVEHLSLKGAGNSIFNKAPDDTRSTFAVPPYSIQFIEIGQNDWS